MLLFVCKSCEQLCQFEQCESHFVFVYTEVCRVLRQFALCGSTPHTHLCTREYTDTHTQTRVCTVSVLFRFSSFVAIIPFPLPLLLCLPFVSVLLDTLCIVFWEEGGGRGVTPSLHNFLVNKVKRQSGA